MTTQALWETQRPLLGRLLCYNEIFDDVHEEHLAPFLPPPLLRCLQKKTLNIQKVYRFFKQHMGIKPVPLKWFQNEPFRLLLLSGEDITRLLKYAGVILNLEGIKKTVHRPQRIALKEYLGGAIYEFALKRSPLHHPFFKTVAVPGNYKSVDIIDGIHNTGKYFIESCFSAAPSEVLARFLLKFPSTEKWNFSHAVDFETKNYIFSLLKRLLIKEINHPFSICL